MTRIVDFTHILLELHKNNRLDKINEIDENSW